METKEIEGLFIGGRCYTLLRYGKRLSFRAISFDKENNMWNVKVPHGGTQGFGSMLKKDLLTIRELTDGEIKEMGLWNETCCKTAKK